MTTKHQEFVCKVVSDFVKCALCATAAVFITHHYDEKSSAEIGAASFKCASDYNAIPVAKPGEMWIVKEKFSGLYGAPSDDGVFITAVTITLTAGTPKLVYSWFNPKTMASGVLLPSLGDKLVSKVEGRAVPPAK